MFTVGIGHLIVAKGLPSGAFGCASFLVDTHCLGVKEAFYRKSAPSDSVEAAEALSGGGTGMIDMDPAAAKKLVPEAVAYAAESGITPAKHYRVTFGDLDRKLHLQLGRQAALHPGPEGLAEVLP